MAGKERHIYPGNNTPEGFYSYYQYILGQEEADKILCIKGGPGVGKSTFMKKIADEMLEAGHDIDFMHCSSDNSSLDGIVIKDKKIALLDGTAPHVVDPIHPGAVDSIIHLGDYWNEDGIRENKDGVIGSTARIKNTYEKAYNYLAAAGKMHENLMNVYSKGIKNTEIYKIAASIIVKELAHKEISVEQGEVKKYFASAITPGGCVNDILSLLKGYDTVYVIEAPVGVSSENLLKQFAESALYRGYDIESYYCPMNPSEKMEHLLVPKLDVAFTTSNKYHEIDKSKIEGNVVTIDLSKVIDYEIVDFEAEIANDSLVRMDELIEMAIDCFKKCKTEHDNLESYYIPNMDFKKIESIRQEWLEKLKK